MRKAFKIGFSWSAYLAIFIACAQLAFADGGRLRFRQPAGPFIVTLFTTPDPLARGRADFSVAVERAGTDELVQDADVDLVLTPADGRGTPLKLHASHAAATSKWLQAANFTVPASGAWRVTVEVRRGNEAGQCSGEVQVKPSAAENLTWDILPVPLLALLFVLHQNRKRKYARERRSRHSAETARSTPLPVRSSRPVVSSRIPEYAASDPIKLSSRQ